MAPSRMAACRRWRKAALWRRSSSRVRSWASRRRASCRASSGGQLQFAGHGARHAAHVHPGQARGYAPPVVPQHAEHGGLDRPHPHGEFPTHAVSPDMFVAATRERRPASPLGGWPRRRVSRRPIMSIRHARKRGKGQGPSPVVIPRVIRVPLPAPWPMKPTKPINPMGKRAIREPSGELPVPAGTPDAPRSRRQRPGRRTALPGRIRPARSGPAPGCCRPGQSRARA